MRFECTRRAALRSMALLPFGARSERGRFVPAERIRFSDVSTETPVQRLTNPAHSCWLPPPPAMAVSRRGTFLLYASDRGGSLQGYRMDLRSGDAAQLTDAAALDGASLNLLPDERACVFFDGGSLRLLELGGRRREREVYRVRDGFTRTRGLAVSWNGSHACFVEERDGACQLRLVHLPKGNAGTALEVRAELSEPVLRPRGEGILYRRDADLWVCGYDGQANHRLPLAPGKAARAFWSPDGGSVYYLNLPEDRTRLNSIREADAQANTEQLVASTSQYADLGANGDASVFVGASGSRAAPFILLMLRVTRRELALCEHRSSDPARVAPRFSLDSQRVFFHSDRHGHPAIYMVGVERLVERTDA